MSALGTALTLGATTRQLKRLGVASATLLVMTAASPASAQETVEYYGLDALGSVRVVYDAVGAETGRLDYLPFGEEVTSSAGLPTKRFTGQERDAEAALDYFHARMYQPRSGRFNAVDPVYAGLSDTQQWNRYSYVRNSSPNAVDPSGMQVWICYFERRPDPDRDTVNWIPHYCDNDFGGGHWTDRNIPGPSDGGGGPPPKPDPPKPDPPKPDPPVDTPPPPPDIPPYDPPPPPRPPTPPRAFPPGVVGGACVGAAFAAVTIPIETAMGLACAASGPGVWACILALHHAAAPGIELAYATAFATCVAVDAGY